MTRLCTSIVAVTVLLAVAGPSGARATKGTADHPRPKVETDLLLPALHCSIAAYEEKISDYKGWKELKIELVGEPFTYKDYEVRCFLARRGKALVVAFRGTVATKIANWYADLDAKLVPISEGSPIEVHRGFKKAFDESMEKKLRELLKAKRKPDDQIVFTGHSLGGALALIAAWQLRDLELKPVVYTFGQPHVGNKEFAKALDTCGVVHRFVTANDPVPRALKIKKLAYDHGTEAIYIGKKGLVLSTIRARAEFSLTAVRIVGELLKSERTLQELAKGGQKAALAMLEAHGVEESYLECLSAYVKAHQ
jgi:hypothetical protein